MAAKEGTAEAEVEVEEGGVAAAETEGRKGWERKEKGVTEEETSEESGKGDAPAPDGKRCG